MSFRAKYGAVGLTIVREEFIAEGINEAGLSAGLFYFPHYGKYPAYDSTRNDRTLSDLQYVAWILSQFSSVDEVKAATQTVRVVSIDPSVGSTVHWRIADATGKQVVLEFIDGEPRFYDNEVGVLTNSPDFPWQITNLNNYVNLHPGNAEAQRIGNVRIFPFGAGSGFLGIPGDVTPPSRFVRIAFYKATAPGMRDGTRCGIAELPYSEQLRHSDRESSTPKAMLPTYRARRSGPRRSIWRTADSTTKRRTTTRSAAST